MVPIPLGRSGRGRRATGSSVRATPASRPSRWCRAPHRTAARSADRGWPFASGTRPRRARGVTAARTAGSPPSAGRRRRREAPRGLCEPPACNARAARYKPTGHPSVRSSRRSSSASLRCTPAPSSRRRASGAFIASSSTPTSTTSPPTRRRAIGSGGSARVASASREPAGRCRATSAIVSRQSSLWSDSTWSRTRTTGSFIAEIAPATRDATAATERPPTEGRRSSEPIGSIRSSAAAVYDTSRPRSLSCRSSDSQANREG